jgi:hypothetical protein
VLRRGWSVCDEYDDDDDDVDASGECPPGSVTLFHAYATSFSDIFLRTTVQVETAPEKLYLVLAELLISLLFGAIAGVIFSQISSMRTTQGKKTHFSRCHFHTKNHHVAETGSGQT